jgi:hypothetical protein
MALSVPGTGRAVVESNDRSQIDCLPSAPVTGNAIRLPSGAMAPAGVEYSMGANRFFRAVP